MNTFLQELKEKRATYSDMIDFCCDNLILNNDIVEKLQLNGYYFDAYCGSLFDDEEENEYKEIYQYYIISERDAQRLAIYTNELVLYNNEIDLYILCVCHCGTSWSGISSNWK